MKQAVFAMFAVDEDGNETIVALMRKGTWFPAVCSELELILSIRDAIKGGEEPVGGDKKANKYRIVKFVRNQVILEDMV